MSAHIAAAIIPATVIAPAGKSGTVMIAAKSGLTAAAAVPVLARRDVGFTAITVLAGRRVGVTAITTLTARKIGTATTVQSRTALSARKAALLCMDCGARRSAGMAAAGSGSRWAAAWVSAAGVIAAAMTAATRMAAAVVSTAFVVFLRPSHGRGRKADYGDADQKFLHGRSLSVAALTHFRFTQSGGFHISI